MSNAAAADAGVTGFGRAAIQAAKEPILYVAATAPWWSKWLTNVSEFAAAVGPILAVILAIARIYVILRDQSDAGANRFSKVEKAGGLAGATVGTAAKLGSKWLAPSLAALGLVAVAAWMLTPSKAAAAPVAPASVKPKRRSKDDAGEDDGPIGDFQPGSDAPPQWYLNAYADRGQHERPGNRHNPVIVGYFKEAGFPGVRDDETAWCAAFVNAQLERCGIPGSKSLAARSFEKWGEECEPRIGCIVVMWRGKPSGWQGHVGFYAGETDNHVIVLGGNQGDSVSLAKFPKTRVVDGGYRWPRAATKSRTIRATVASGTLGAKAAVIDAVAPTPEAAAPILEAVEPVKGSLSQLAVYVPMAGKVAAVLAVALALYAAWRRYQDHKERGV